MRDTESRNAPLSAASTTRSLEVHVGWNCFGTIGTSSGEFLMQSSSTFSLDSISFLGDDDDIEPLTPEEISRDLQLYQSLQNDKKVVSIDMTRVHCFTNKRSVMVGLQIVYAVGYCNGKLVEVASDCHNPQNMGIQRSTLELEVGEYVVNARVRYGILRSAAAGIQDRVVKGITLATQRGRVANLGGQPKKDIPVMTQQAYLGKKVIVLVTRKSSDDPKSLASDVAFYTEPIADTENSAIAPLKRRTFTLHDRSGRHRLSQDTPLTDAQDRLQHCCPAVPSKDCAFGDLDFYQRLLLQRQQGHHPVKVELKRIKCFYRHNHSIVGVFGVYRSAFANDKAVESQSIDYEQHANLWKHHHDVQLASMMLWPDEFAVDLQVRQERGVLTIVTSQRTVSLGSSETTKRMERPCYEDKKLGDFHHRVVALAGIRVTNSPGFPSSQSPGVGRLLVPWSRLGHC
ncbi:expressed unknown protein [Seminavis robusta]|uniref:Uncharacterized protein n=1 Tax=Seminavis robusta TaxID=568900 RepID=A0A9N8EX85_9STRA|nr:expressed unknown protein [Seminavis robusta]|eukprot:Sro2355_g324550.1 n/a (457) ;mRNA; r:7953-9323